MGHASVKASTRAIVAAWRQLTSPPGTRRRGSGEPVLVACSGGADSSALVLALASARAPGIVAHVVHDLRPRRTALRDRDAARRLAGRVGWPFVETEVRVRSPRGNLEALARRARYAALTELAQARGIDFIATAHHADDQLETILMRLLRGSEPSRLAGVAGSRRLPPAGGVVCVPPLLWREGGRMRVLGQGPLLIRPMLGVSRDDARAICRAARWKWAQDATNRDTTRLRARLRARVVPLLKRIRPDVLERVADLAALSRQTRTLVAARAKRITRAAARTPAARRWRRADLCRCVREGEELAVGEALRAACVCRGAPPDSLPARVVHQIVRAVTDGDGTPRRWTAGGCRIELTRSTLTVRAGPAA